MGKYQRAIRIGGKLKKSPKFDRKADADRWYLEQSRKKQFFKEGLHMPVDEKITLKEWFHKDWYPKRKKKYTAATHGPDFQRFRDYVEPKLGHFRLANINALQVKSCLESVVDEHGQSIVTRTRVRALLSKLFNDALNSNPPLRTFNPALNIKFDDARTGKKKPVFIKREEDAAIFLETAEELGPMHFAYAGITLMAGLRKSEVAGLKWGDFDPSQKTLTVSRRFVQAENKMFDGTKAGSEEERPVPIPDALIEILLIWQRESPFNLNDDFILFRHKSKTNKRNFMSNRHISHFHDEIREASGVNVPPHALRHTYGRSFIKKQGNKEVLRQILGHSSTAVTDIYSKLDVDATIDFRNTVSYKQKGQKK